MSAGRRYFESPLDTLLTFDIAEIQIEMGIFPEKFRTSIDYRRFQLDLPFRKRITSVIFSTPYTSR